MAVRELAKLTEEQRKILRECSSEYPVKLGQLARELGVQIRVSSLPAGVSGQVAREGNQYVVRVNRHEARERQRFTIAHELSHYLLHRHVIDSSPDGITDNVLYRSGASESVEFEANRLAAQIVMPMDPLRNELNERFGGLITDATIEELALRFEVSKAAMEIRLSTLVEA